MDAIEDPIWHSFLFLFILQRYSIGNASRQLNHYSIFSRTHVKRNLQPSFHWHFPLCLYFLFTDLSMLIMSLSILMFCGFTFSHANSFFLSMWLFIWPSLFFCILLLKLNLKLPSPPWLSFKIDLKHSGVNGHLLVLYVSYAMLWLCWRNNWTPPECTLH